MLDLPQPLRGPKGAAVLPLLLSGMHREAPCDGEERERLQLPRVPQ